MSFQDVDVERVAAPAIPCLYRFDIVALGSKFERRQQQKPCHQRIAEHRLGEHGHPEFVRIEIPTDTVATRSFQNVFGALEQLLMLHLFFAEAKQCPQSWSVVMPIFPGDFGHLNGNEFLVVTEQVSVTEGSNVVEHPLLAIAEKCEVFGAHPRIRHRSPGGIETAVSEDIVHGPKYLPILWPQEASKTSSVRWNSC